MVNSAVGENDDVPASGAGHVNSVPDKPLSFACFSDVPKVLSVVLSHIACSLLPSLATHTQSHKR